MSCTAPTKLSVLTSLDLRPTRFSNICADRRRSRIGMTAARGPRNLLPRAVPSTFRLGFRRQPAHRMNRGTENLVGRSGSGPPVGAPFAYCLAVHCRHLSDYQTSTALASAQALFFANALNRSYSSKNIRPPRAGQVPPGNPQPYDRKGRPEGGRSRSGPHPAHLPQRPGVTPLEKNRREFVQHLREDAGTPSSHRPGLPTLTA